MVFNKTLVLFTLLTQNNLHILSPPNVTDVYMRMETDDYWTRLEKVYNEELHQQVFRKANVTTIQDLIVYKVRIAYENGTFWDSPGWLVTFEFDIYPSKKKALHLMRLEDYNCWTALIIMITLLWWPCMLLFLVWLTRIGK